MERHVYIEHYDYRRFFESTTEDTILIEWDIAIGFTSRTRFEKAVSKRPDEVQVAPYRLHPISTLRPSNEVIWAHRDSHANPVNTYDPACVWFGFGLIYFPQETVKQYISEIPHDEQCNDQSFSLWHQKAFPGRRVKIHWDVNVTHLHY